MSFRTLIEIFFPASIAPVISDWLIWGVPIVAGIGLLAMFRDFARHNLGLCIFGAVVLYFACIYGEANTQYKDNNENLAKGDAIWYNLIKLGAHNHDEAEAGQISWEEYYYRRAILQQGVDLVCEGAMSASAFNNEASTFLNTYADREERIRTLKAGLDGGTISHWAYRISIDKMNQEPGPFQEYQLARDKERDGWRFVILGPFVYTGLILAAMALVYKPLSKLYTVWEISRGNARFAKALKEFTHGRSLNDMATVDGPLKLAYPTLFVGEVPHDLRRSFIDGDHPNLLHVGSTGSRLYLYSAAPTTRQHSDPTPRKREFFFHEGPPPKPADAPVLTHARKSIFDAR